MEWIYTFRNGREQLYLTLVYAKCPESWTNFYVYSLYTLYCTYMTTYHCNDVSIEHEWFSLRVLLIQTFIQILRRESARCASVAHGPPDTNKPSHDGGHLRGVGKRWPQLWRGHQECWPSETSICYIFSRTDRTDLAGIASWWFSDVLGLRGLTQCLLGLPSGWESIHYVGAGT